MSNPPTGLLIDGRACLRLGRRADGAGRARRLLLQHRPVERVVVLVVERAEQYAEQLPQVHVVGRLLKTQSAAVVQVHRELGGETLARATEKYVKNVFDMYGSCQIGI